MIKELPLADYPEWLASLTQSSMMSDIFPLQELLKDSLYYPSCGFDGSPVKHLGGQVYSFIYVDYGYNKDKVLTELYSNGFKGYRPIAHRKVTKNELMPNNPAGQPDYLLYSGYGWPERYDRPCRPLYPRRVSGAGRNLWAKN